MKYRKVLVLILVVLAVSWRYFTYTSFDKVGFIGISQNDKGVITSVSPDSPAANRGLIVGDKILSVKGQGANERTGPNQSMEYTLLRNNNQLVIPLSSSKLPKDQVTMTRTLGVMGVLILLIGAVIFYQVKNNISFVFFLYCFTMVIHWGYFPQVISNYSQNIITSLYSFVSMFMGSLILHFALMYPRNRTLSSSKYYLIYAPGVIGALLFIGSLLNPDLISIFNLAEFILVTVYTLIGYIVLIKIYIRTPPIKREMVGINVIVWGILIGNIPYLLSTFLPFMDFGSRIGTLIIGDGSQPIKNSMVIVMGNTIIEVGRVGEINYLNNAEVINLDGKCIIPGLMDISIFILKIKINFRNLKLILSRTLALIKKLSKTQVLTNSPTLLSSTTQNNFYTNFNNHSRS